MYFNSFPVIPYDSSGNLIFKDVTNLMRRIGLRTKVRGNALLYDTYDVKEGETPEIIAHKLYGDAKLHWVVLMVNDITDRYHQWPMSTPQFLDYINDKYDNPDGIHHYETTQDSGDTKISRLILNNLQGFKDGNSNNIFDAYYISEKKEEIVSKDKKGNPSSYKIQIEVNLELISKNNDKKFSKKFVKETTYNSIDNNFELNKYKKKLEKNLTSQILQDMNNFFDIVGNDR